MNTVQIKLKKTREGALCISTIDKAQLGIAVLDPSADFPPVSGVDIVFNCYRNDDATNYVSVSDFNDMPLAMRKIGLDHAKRLVSKLKEEAQIANFPLLTTMMNLETNDAVLTIDLDNDVEVWFTETFYKGLISCFYGKEDRVTAFFDYLKKIDWSYDVYDSIVRILPEYKIFFAAPLLRGYFKTAISSTLEAVRLIGDEKASEILAGIEDLLVKTPGELTRKSILLNARAFSVIYPHIVAAVIANSRASQIPSGITLLTASIAQFCPTTIYFDIKKNIKEELEKAQYVDYVSASTIESTLKAF